MDAGTQVRNRAGEIGVVLAGGDEQLLQVAFPSGRRTLHRDELEPVAPEPDEELRAGRLGPSIPYGLRLQARYLKHAYRYDPASGLSNARIEPLLHQVYA